MQKTTNYHLIVNNIPAKPTGNSLDQLSNGSLATVVSANASFLIDNLCSSRMK